jgi:hypothetical protein
MTTSKRPILIDLLAEWRQRAVDLRAAGNAAAADERLRAANELDEWWREVLAEGMAMLPSGGERWSA